MDTTRAIGKAKLPKTMTVTPTGPRTLPVGFPLDNGVKGEGHAEYIIEKVLGDGGFGIVYKAKARMRSKNGRALSWTDFAVKEFFHRECSRSETFSLVDRSEMSFKEAKSRFKKEAEKLHELEIPNVIEVNECFERNNTVYYVMQFVEGHNLQEYVAGKYVGSSENCALTEHDALAVMTPIIEAVEKLHNNKLLHLDIKPNNIMLGKEGGERDKYVKIGDADLVPILIDFGTSVSSNSLNRKVEVKYRTEGYSSPEQSYPDQFGYKNEFDRRLDVFALGATMYFLLTGLTPPDAPAQMEKFDGFIKDIEAGLKAHSIGDIMRCAIVNAMNPYRQRRTASARQLLNELGAGTELEAEMSKREKRRRRNALLYLLAFVIVGGVAFYMWVMPRDEVMNGRRLQEAIDLRDRITLIEYATMDSIRAIDELVRGYEKDNNTLMAWYWAEYAKSHKNSINGDKAILDDIIARSEVLRENLVNNVDTSTLAYKFLMQRLDSTQSKTLKIQQNPMSGIVENPIMQSNSNSIKSTAEVEQTENVDQERNNTIIENQEVTKNEPSNAERYKIAKNSNNRAEIFTLACESHYEQAVNDAKVFLLNGEIKGAKKAAKKFYDNNKNLFNVEQQEKIEQLFVGSW